jgi:hypothetical protein
MIIPGKSIDESCDGAPVPACCHVKMSSDQDQDYEVGLTSSRADFKTLIGRAASTVARQDCEFILLLNISTEMVKGTNNCGDRDRICILVS